MVTLGPYQNVIAITSQNLLPMSCSGCFAVQKLTARDFIFVFSRSYFKKEIAFLLLLLAPSV